MTPTPDENWSPGRVVLRISFGIGRLGTPQANSNVKERMIEVSKRNKRRGLSAVLLMGGLLALAVQTLPAAADTFGHGPPDEGYEADSVIHTYCFEAAFDADLEEHADYAMQTSIDVDTDVQDLFVGTCDSTVDVEWRDANLDPGVRGQYQCISLSGTICFASRVTLDPDELDEGFFDFWDRRKTACHEAGHSLGLRHGARKGDCMRNGEIPNTDLRWRRFNDHHIFHIDLTY